MSAEPTLAWWYMYVTKCLFQSSKTKCKLDTCLIEMYRNNFFSRILTNFKKWQNSWIFTNFKTAGPRILDLCAWVIRDSLIRDVDMMLMLAMIRGAGGRWTRARVGTSAGRCSRRRGPSSCTWRGRRSPSTACRCWSSRPPTVASAPPSGPAHACTPVSQVIIIIIIIIIKRRD